MPIAYRPETASPHVQALYTWFCDLDDQERRDRMEHLSYRKHRMLELRFGLADERPRTLKEIGRTFNVSAERVRQSVNQAITEMRAAG